ncbi:uncharacterized protein [Chelonus insularis]|uniref:uncharacterized protein n=1 Tax=Chelonus insularis TaxID=460826 RepID=UPI001589D52A|nr:uncharacterized protein LOC118066299 [Chelonus insularis]
MIIRLWPTIVIYISVKLVGSESKPLEHVLNEYSNRIDYGSQRNYKMLHSEKKKSFEFTLPPSSEIIKTNNAEARASDELQVIETTEINNLTDAQTSVKTPVTTLSNNLTNFNNNNNLLSTLLVTLLQKFQFSPQMFFQDRLNQLKQILINFGLIVPDDQVTAKQFPNINRLLNVIGLDNSDFYTNRLEPGGLFGGNGFWSNKGGLLGGPGAFASTGPIFTDYPTPYRKK